MRSMNVPSLVRQILLIILSQVGFHSSKSNKNTIVHYLNNPNFIYLFIFCSQTEIETIYIYKSAVQIILTRMENVKVYKYIYIYI